MEPKSMIMWFTFVTFAHKDTLWIMAKIEKINNVNDYVHYVGAEELHPHVAVIHYDELDNVRHSLNNYNVYGLFLQKAFPYGLAYGMGNYAATDGSLIAVAPGQTGGIPDDGSIIHLHGWVLMFDPDFIRGTDLERHMDDFHFFNYNSNEALKMLPDEKRTVTALIKMIRYELKNNRSADFTDDIVRSYIRLILQYCRRFYNRQFHEEASGKNDLLVRFRKVIGNYYEKKLYVRNGTPSVSYCAGELFLSPNYFGDLVKTATGDTATHYIRHFVIDRAKSMLVSGQKITETAMSLGFEYPQHFSRVFKQETGMSPSQFLETKK